MLFMKNQVCKLIYFGDVAGGLGTLVDGWRVQEMVGSLGDSWVTLGGFLEVSVNSTSK